VLRTPRPRCSRSAGGAARPSACPSARRTAPRSSCASGASTRTLNTNSLTAEKALGQLCDFLAADCLEHLLRFLVVLAEGPVVGAGEDVQTPPEVGRGGEEVAGSFGQMQKLEHPTVPSLVELPQQLPPMPLLRQAVVQRVQHHQLQVLEGPVVGH